MKEIEVVYNKINSLIALLTYPFWLYFILIFFITRNSSINAQKIDVIGKNTISLNSTYKHPISLIVPTESGLKYYSSQTYHFRLTKRNIEDKNAFIVYDYNDLAYNTEVSNCNQAKTSKEERPFKSAAIVNAISLLFKRNAKWENVLATIYGLEVLLNIPRPFLDVLVTNYTSDFDINDSYSEKEAKLARALEKSLDQYYSMNIEGWKSTHQECLETAKTRLLNFKPDTIYLRKAIEKTPKGKLTLSSGISLGRIYTYSIDNITYNTVNVMKGLIYRMSLHTGRFYRKKRNNRSMTNFALSLDYADLEAQLDSLPGVMSELNHRFNYRLGSFGGGFWFNFTDHNKPFKKNIGGFYFGMGGTAGSMRVSGQAESEYNGYQASALDLTLYFESQLSFALASWLSLDFGWRLTGIPNVRNVPQNTQGSISFRFIPCRFYNYKYRGRF
jgi:hypothetical protein